LKHVNIAVLGSKELSGKLGKKGTSSDFSLYNLKESNSIACFLEPTTYPEKLQPLLYSISLADYIVLVVEKVDKFLGETIVALDLLGKKNGLLAVSDGVSEPLVNQVIAGTVAASYERVPLDATEIRVKAISFSPERKAGPVKIPVDHSFNVKSVGNVVLGVVERGEVKKHQKLELLPAGKQVEAKSLQVHDQDVSSAETGSRVGVSVKGAELEEMRRGSVLAEPGSLRASGKIAGKLTVSKYFKQGVKPGAQFFYSRGMQFIQARLLGEKQLLPGESAGVELELSSPAVFEKGDKALIAFPDSKDLRIAGLLDV